jgi:TolA-binding protein
MKSASPFCPDDRVALARRGALSLTEWQEFAVHLAECADCRIAFRLGKDFDESAALRPGDERLIARGVKRALSASARPRRAVLRLALAASVTLVAAGAASAAIVLHQRYAAPTSPAATSAQLRPARGPAARRVPPAATEAAPIPPLPAAETEEAAVAPAAPPPTEPPPGTRPAAKPAGRAPEPVAFADPFDVPGSALLSPPPVRDDAASLFAQAVSERKQGRAQLAIAAFRSLQRRFPESREATVALVSLGDLLLGAGHRAEALLAFETYLLRAPGGALQPEAMVGKARALEALGRVREAAASWREIARRFPDSPYAQPGAGIGGSSP